jgi:hypothetical protein
MWNFSMVSSVQTSHSLSNIYIHVKCIHRKIPSPKCTPCACHWIPCYPIYLLCLWKLYCWSRPLRDSTSQPMDTLECIHETTQDAGNPTEQGCNDKIPQTRQHKQRPPLSHSCNLEFQRQRWQLIPSEGCERRTSSPSLLGLLVTLPSLYLVIPYSLYELYECLYLCPDVPFHRNVNHTGLGPP